MVMNIDLLLPRIDDRYISADRGNLAVVRSGKEASFWCITMWRPPHSSSRWHQLVMRRQATAYNRWCEQMKNYETKQLVALTYIVSSCLLY